MCEVQTIEVPESVLIHFNEIHREKKYAIIDCGAPVSLAGKTWMEINTADTVNIDWKNKTADTGRKK